MKIGLLVGSVREGRVGRQVGDYLLDFANKRNDEGVTYELVDLKDYRLPLLGYAPTEEEAATIKKWSEKMASFDGYVIITPEYNRLVPGALKNALDYLGPEVHNKAVGYSSYGGLYGLSAVQSLRLSNAEQEMASVRTMATFSIVTDFENMQTFKPNDYHAPNINKMLDQLIAWSRALKTIR